MAQWGIAMSNLHPLWAPPTAAELAEGQAALATARRFAPKTKRERDWIDALTSFYDKADSLNHGARTTAYVTAMERLHRDYPADTEAAVFTALALFNAGTTSGKVSKTLK